MKHKEGYHKEKCLLIAVKLSPLFLKNKIFNVFAPLLFVTLQGSGLF